MNTMERFAAALQLRQADRVPVVAQVFGHAAVMAGVDLGEYVRDGETLARCQLNALRHYGYDAVFSVMDVNVETEAVGSTLTYRRGRYPVIERYAVSLESDFDTLASPDPETSGRMPEMLKALSILRDELQDETLVVGCVMGPFTLASQMLGLESALYLAIDDPVRLERLMDFATDVLIAFGQAQLRSGAHLPVVFDPAASPAVVPPSFFREFELPRLRRVFDELSAAGSVANWLHIAGPVEPILAYYPQARVDLANFDYYVGPAEACDKLPSTCLDGNVRSLAFVEASPQEIEAQSLTLVRFFRERGGFVLSSGCEIPPEAASENIAAMVAAARTV